MTEKNFDSAVSLTLSDTQFTHDTSTFFAHHALRVKGSRERRRDSRQIENANSVYLPCSLHAFIFRICPNIFPSNRISPRNRNYTVDAKVLIGKLQTTWKQQSSWQDYSSETVWNAGGLLFEKQQGSCMEYSRETVWNAGGLLLEKQQGSCMEYSRDAVWNTAGKLYGIQQGSCMEFSRDAVWNTGSCLENNWSAAWNTAEKLCGTQTAA